MQVESLSVILINQCFNVKGNLGRQIACWKQELRNEVKMIKEKYTDLEKELEVSNQLRELSDGKYHSLEREFKLLKEDRDAMHQRISTSSQTLAQQKENALKELNIEARRRKKLEEEIKQFSVAFACRQRSGTSFHSEFKSILDNMNPTTSLSKSHGS